MTARPRRAALVTAVLGALALSACGSDDPAPTAGGEVDLTDFASVLEAAQGQTVDWYMFGGDDRLNSYVNGYVATELAERGVTLNQVRITDTVEAVDKVLGEVQAGRTDDGTVDMIWINGENFSTGKQADLWYCGWDTVLPSSEFVDFEDPLVANDFGEPVEGCEAAWNRAQSVLVYDSATVPEEATRSLTALEEWITGNPGRFAYPAPPDFTGSLVVKTFFADTAGYDDSIYGAFDEAAYEQYAQPTFDRLNALEASLYRGGETYPAAGPDVSQLYADGEIDAYISYGAGDLGVEVEDGNFPETTRSAVFDDGTIGNVNFLSIPVNSPDKAGAMVLADLLQSPEAQLEKLVNGPGYYPGIDTTRTGEFAERFAGIQTPPAQLPFEEQVVNGKPELQAAWLERIEQDWAANVLQQ